VRDAVDQIILLSERWQGGKVVEFVIKVPTLVEAIEVEPEEMKQSNIIVQRVLDANSLLEAFGNAKTQWNENSSRFSRHSKL
jgi:myosin heavy subunit